MNGTKDTVTKERSSAGTYTASEQRYDFMPYPHVGKSGLRFPAVSLGFWHNFGDAADFENMRAMMRTAFDHGITQFDLANNYGPGIGAAERNCGKILAQDFKSYRDELVITSKAGYDMWKGPYGNWGSRKYLIASCDQSLKRLGLEYVDIFYHHRPDPNTPLEETLGALKTLVDSGKALYAGISNYDREQTRSAVLLAREMHLPLIVNQRRYSIFDRTIETDGTKEFCAKEGLGIIAFSPLAQGLLTDRYLNGIPSDSRVMTDGRFLHKTDITPEKIKKIRALNDLAKQRGESLAQMALAWVLKDEEVCSVIIGASRPEQIFDNIAFTKHAGFSAQELEKIESICR